jgi:DNA polymerase I
MQIGITQIDYSSARNGTTLHIFGRDADAKAHRIDVTGFTPYFYIPKEQALKMKHPSSMKIDKDTVYHSIYGEELRRVNCDSPISIYMVKNLTQHLEGDISYPTRFMIDCDIKAGIEVEGDFVDYERVKPCNDIKTKARVCFLDIECDDINGFPTPERDGITAITAYDSFDMKYYTFYLNKTDKDVNIIDGENQKTYIYTDEKKMILEFCKHIKLTDPDIISGWNVDKFDADYILKRMNKLELDAGLLGRLPPQKGDKRGNLVIRGRTIFDLLESYKTITVTSGKRESYRLDSVAEYELGERKLHFTGSLNALSRENPQKFIDYNRKDVELCVNIDKKNNIVEFYRELASYVGVTLDKTLQSSSMVDVYVLRKSFGKFILPSKGFATEGKFEGASVLEASTGVKKNVCVIDLKSLYPMSMVTINSSPETKSKDGELHSPNGICFRKDPPGLVKEIIMELLSQRDAKKKLMKSYPKTSSEYKLYDMQQNVIKVLMNSYYGASGYERFRLYDFDIGSAVTSVGRAIIEFTRKYVVSKGYIVIYGDTDSVMFYIPNCESLEESMRLAKLLEEELNAIYPKFAKDELGADVSYFSTKFEKVYKTFFQSGKKKRYAGHLVWKEGVISDEFDIVGFETRRSDSPKLARLVQKTLLEMVLKDSAYNDIKTYLSGIIKKYRKGEYSLEEIGIPGGIQQNLADYVNKDSHVRGCLYSNEHIGMNFKKGSKPKRLYIKSVSSKYPQTDVLCFEYETDVPKEFNVDLELMMQKTIQAPVERILDTLGYTWSEFDPSRTTLSAFGIE